MSKIVLALVGLAQAVSAAATFPHQPVPPSFAERIQLAVAAVSAAALDDPDAFAPGEGGPGLAVDLDALVDGLLAQPAFTDAIVANPEIRIAVIDALVARVEPNLIDILSAKPALLEALAKKLEKPVVKALEAEAAKASNVLHARVAKLEEFAEKVDGDVAARLESLEATLAALKSGAGSASGAAA
jgi:hypothetical protein